METDPASTAETSGEGTSQNRSIPAQETVRRPDDRGEDPRDGTLQEDRKEEDRTGTEVKPDTTEAIPRPGRDQKPAKADANMSPLERAPSAGRFANLAEEFDARAKSRELAQQYAAASGRPTKADSKRDPAVPELDDMSIRGRIDPFAADRDKAEGRKKPFQRNLENEDAEWTDGVATFDDLPSGEKLSEEKRSNFERFRAKAYQKLDDIKDDTEKAAKAIDRIFGPHPTGHAEARESHFPSVVDAPHSGIDPGSAASALIAVGIVGAELVRKVHEKIRGRDN